MFCPNCETEIPDGSKHCTKCGYDLLQRAKTPQRKRPSEDLFNDIGSTGGRSRDPLDGLSTSLGSGVEVGSLQIGTVFAGRYEILSEGLRGGMGEVYKCKDKKLDSIKALKLIHPRLLNSDQAIQRFRQEVSISQSLQHKNIVRVHDLDEYNGIEFFTMEWVEGRSLRGIIAERKKNNKPLTLEEAYKIISQLADALHHAHKKTIHRDIKPENILVFEDEEGLQIKLTDFGIAKMLTPSLFQSSSGQMGTPYYMAPEQKADAAHVDKRADIYAVGVVLFELLTLENTIGFELPSQINKNLPKEIDDILKKALAMNPEDRYTEAKEVSEELGVLISGDKSKEHRKIDEHGQRPEEKKLQMGVKPGSITKKVSIGAALFAIVVIVGIIYMTSFKKETAIMLKESRPLGSPGAAMKAAGDEKGKEGIKEYSGAQKTTPVDPKPSKEQVASVKGTEKETVNRRGDEFKSLINRGLTTHPGKTNVAMIIESPKSESGTIPEAALYRSLKTDRVHVVINLFKEELFKSKGFFREIYDGNTDLLSQTDALSKIDYLILGKLNYSFRKGSEIDKDLVSCNINFNYKVINRNCNVVRSDNISVVAPGFTNDAAMERGLEILSEKYSERIFSSL